MKRKYEGLIVFNTKGKEDGIEAMVTEVSKQIEEEGATLDEVDQLGRRRFPYGSQGLDSGYYVAYRFDAAPESIERVRSKLRLNDNVHIQSYQRR